MATVDLVDLQFIFDEFCMFSICIFGLPHLRQLWFAVVGASSPARSKDAPMNAKQKMMSNRLFSENRVLRENRLLCEDRLGPTNGRSGARLDWGKSC